MMLFNIQKNQIENLKLFKIKDAKVTAINFGPFDNGYIILGFSNGALLAVDLHNMQVIMHI